MVDACRVDDPGCVFEAVAVEARGRLVQRHVVEDFRQRAFVEVAADDRHGVDRRHRRHAQTAERRDQAAAGSVLERQVAPGRRGRRRRPAWQSAARSPSCRCRSGRGSCESRRDVFSPRAVCASSAITRWYALAVEITRHGGRTTRTSESPSGSRSAARWPERTSGVEPVAVALRRQLADELADEQPAVREDEDAGSAGRLHEACCRNRLTGGCRVTKW